MSESNFIPGGPLDKAFVVFHRMITVMSEAEPSVKVVLLAFDENDDYTASAILVSNMKYPQEVENLLKQGLESATMKRVLQNSIVK